MEEEEEVVVVVVLLLLLVLPGHRDAQHLTPEGAKLRLTPGRVGRPAKSTVKPQSYALRALRLTAEENSTAVPALWVKAAADFSRGLTQRTLQRQGVAEELAAA